MTGAKECVSCESLLEFKICLVSELSYASEQSRVTSSARASLFLQWLDCHFLEEHDVVVAVILQAEPSIHRTGSVLRLKVELPVRHRIAFFEVSDFLSIQHNDCPRPV